MGATPQPFDFAYRFYLLIYLQILRFSAAARAKGKRSKSRASFRQRLSLRVESPINFK